MSIKDIKEAQRESQSLGAFYIHVLSIFAIKLVFILVMCAFAAIPLAMFFIGMAGENSCPLQDRLVVYLITSGAVGSLLTFGVVYYLCRFRRIETGDMEEEPDDPCSVKSCYPVGIMLLVFLFGWFVAGHIWLLRVNPANRDSEDESSDEYCSNSVYYMTIASFVLTYAIVANVLVILLLLALYFYLSKQPPTDNNWFDRKGTHDHQHQMPAKVPVPSISVTLE